MAEWLSGWCVQLLNSNITSTIVELVFKEVCGARAAGGKLSKKLVSKSPMHFDHFTVALTRLAALHSKPLADAAKANPTTALLMVAEWWILKQFRLVDTAAEEAALDTREVRMVWSAVYKPMKQVYDYYSGCDAVGAIQGRSRAEALLEMNEMSTTEFISFAYKWRLVPAVASIEQLRAMFREVNRGEEADDNANDLSWDEFTQLLGRCALRWYDQHHDCYGNPKKAGRVKSAKKLRRDEQVIAAEKLQALLGQLDPAPGCPVPRDGIEDYQQATGRSSFTLFPRGRGRLWMTMDEAAVITQSVWRMHVKRVAFLKHFQLLRDEAARVEREKLESWKLIRSRREILKHLGLIFEEECSRGEAEVRQLMKHDKFYRMLRDCKCLDKNTSKAWVDLLVKKSTADDPIDKLGLDFDQFKEMLKSFAERRFKLSNRTMGMLLMVDHYIIPRLEVDLCSEERKQLADPQVKSLWRKSRVSLQTLYDHYANMELAGAIAGRSYAEIGLEMVQISVGEFDKFCRDFEISPVFFSRVELAKLFRTVNRGEAADGNSNNADFDEFCECLGRIAIRIQECRSRAPKSTAKKADKDYVAGNVPNRDLGAPIEETVKGGVVTVAHKVQWLLDYLDASRGVQEYIVTTGKSKFTLFPYGRIKFLYTHEQACGLMQALWRGHSARKNVQNEALGAELLQMKHVGAAQKKQTKKERRKETEKREETERSCSDR